MAKTISSKDVLQIWSEAVLSTNEINIAKSSFKNGEIPKIDKA